MIDVRGLVKHIGTTEVLSGVTFTAHPGTVTGLLGPNGAGKTTTMRVLATLLRPEEGTVHLCGVDALTAPTDARRLIGLVTEEPGLYDRLTVREQLVFAARAHGYSVPGANQRLDELADALDVGPTLECRAGTLSKGNRQKVSLCRALIHDPPILLLDEPTSGLDVVAADGLEALLERPDVIGHKTVLLSTHRLDEAERLASTVIGIANGRIIIDATPDEVVARSGERTFREAFVRILGDASMSSDRPGEVD